MNPLIPLAERSNLVICVPDLATVLEICSAVIQFVRTYSTAICARREFIELYPEITFETDWNVLKATVDLWKFFYVYPVNISA